MGCWLIVVDALIRRIISRILFLLFGLVLACLIAELAFKTFIPAPKLFWGPESAATIRYDSYAGWLPSPDEINYSDQAVYLPKFHPAPGAARVIFLGDSVVVQGLISDAFVDLLGGQIEVLPVGVSGYDTRQEVYLFKSRAVSIKPKIVLLLLHPNDFDVGISAVLGNDRTLRVANSYGDEIPINESLFWHSSVAQFVLQSALRISSMRFSRMKTIEKSLAELAMLAKREQFSLVVVMLPWFKWQEEWSKVELERKQRISEIITSLQICHLDLAPTLTLARGRMESLQATPGDVHHPNVEYARLLARFILDQSFNSFDRTKNGELAVKCP